MVFVGMHYGGSRQDVMGNDRIIDTPYVIDTNNVDRYPLMSPKPTQSAPKATEFSSSEQHAMRAHKPRL